MSAQEGRFTNPTSFREPELSLTGRGPAHFHARLLPLDAFGSSIFTSLCLPLVLGRRTYPVVVRGQPPVPFAAGQTSRAPFRTSAALPPLASSVSTSAPARTDRRTSSLAPAPGPESNTSRLRIALLQAVLDLLPLHGSGNGRSFFGAQRIHADGRLVVVVLAPVHQHLAGAQRLLHVGDDQVRMLPLQQACQLMRKRLGLVIGNGGVQRNVNLQTLRS